MKQRAWIIFFVIFVLGMSVCNAQKLSLKDGDRVVFYGDSITAQRLYTRFVEDIFLTRYPQMHITFWNAGVPGDRADGGYTGDMQTRISRDLAPYKPTVVTIMLGMNDGYYMPFDQKYFDYYKDNYRKLIAAVQKDAPSSRITLISPTTYDEITHGTEFAHYSESVDHNAAFVKEIASPQFGFSDFNQAVTNLLKVSHQSDPALAALLVPDRIHPGEAAHWVMAVALARSWGVSPIVSRVHLNAAHSVVIASENTQVTNLHAKGGALQWTQLDGALPLPLQLDDAMMQLVLRNTDIAKLDQQILRVEGLSSEKYILKIDDHKIASFSKEQLTEGVNLALYPTPMLSQAKGVDGQEQKRTHLDEARFTLVIEDTKVAGSADADRVIALKEAQVVQEQKANTQPKPHVFELLPE